MVHKNETGLLCFIGILHLVKSITKKKKTKEQQKKNERKRKRGCNKMK